MPLSGQKFIGEGNAIPPQNIIRSKLCKYEYYCIILSLSLRKKVRILPIETSLSNIIDFEFSIWIICHSNREDVDKGRQMKFISGVLTLNAFCFILFCVY